MFTENDPYSFSVVHNLYKTDPTYPGSAAPEPCGYLTNRFEVKKYDDVEVRSGASAVMRQYHQYFLTCTQTLTMFSPTALDLNPAETSEYSDYPALIKTQLQVVDLNRAQSQSGGDGRPGGSVQGVVVEYDPQTVNTAVQAGTNSGSSGGVNGGISGNAAVNSSDSGTVTFRANVKSMDLVFDSLDLEGSGSATASIGETLGIGANIGGNYGRSKGISDSMSIKDWGAFGYVEAPIQAPAWVFGQEYPWSAVDCRTFSAGNAPSDDNAKVQIQIPPSMAANLYNGGYLYPPSDLSTFGFSFVTKARWKLRLPFDAPDEIIVKRFVQYFSATHAVSGSSVAVYMDQTPTLLYTETGGQQIETAISLPIMALDPAIGAERPAIVGFIPNKYAARPLPVQENGSFLRFSMLSDANTLLVRDNTTYGDDPAAAAGAGFSVGSTTMQARFSAGCGKLRMTAYFKIVDVAHGYKLFMKHWISGTGGVKLTFTFNGEQETKIVKYVNEAESEGAQNNVLAITLRDQHYASADYYDFLQMGLNAIDITIEPSDAADITDVVYQLRAMSVERGA